MPIRREVAITAAAVAAAGVLVGGVAAVSNASTTGAASGTTAAQPAYATAQSTQGQEPREGRGHHAHTPVTGAELARVTAAVKAKDSAVTVVRVRKDPDGSYDVRGTKGGGPVRLEVSKDLATVTTMPARHGGERGEREAHTPVTGAELAKVTAAVRAKDAAVTVVRVSKDSDGSYEVRGTKGGSRVKVEVSADLATVTIEAGHRGDRGDRGGEAPSAPSASSSASSTASSTGTT